MGESKVSQRFGDWAEAWYDQFRRESENESNPNIEGEACVVDKVIELPAQRFKQFSRALLADYDFIAENKNVIQYDADSRHCMLILDADRTRRLSCRPTGV